MNVHLLLNRLCTSEYGTFGVLLLSNGPVTEINNDHRIPFAVTLERRWLNNKRSISCIPTGAYTVKRVSSPRFGETFKVTNVEGRSHILFHKGNRFEDSHGCILVGEEFGFLNGEPAILSSGRGYKEFMDRFQGRDEFGLLITWNRSGSLYL